MTEPPGDRWLTVRPIHARLDEVTDDGDGLARPDLGGDGIELTGALYEPV